jgi:hypothetical protein
MNRTPIHVILNEDDDDDDQIIRRLDRLERMLLSRQPARAAAAYQSSNVVKGQADCVGCAQRSSTTEKVMYFSLGVVLTTMITLLVRNMKNNQGRRKQ